MGEPQSSFQYALFKAQWAYRHINDLNHFCQGFVRANPYSIQAERNDDGVMVIHTGINPGMPREIPLFAGDAVHALRCALDYCWMGLERAANPEKAGKHTFPFSEDSQGLIAPGAKAAKRWSRPEIEVFILDKVKPYRAGNAALWTLNRLDNRDKHNLLLISLGKIVFDRFRLTAQDGSTVTGDGMSLIVGEMFPFAAVGSPGDHVDIHYEINTPVDVVLAESGVIENALLVPTLLDMAQAVTTTVELFQKIFD